jgi:F-type H+-transporting ATPase subunit delta
MELARRDDQVADIAEQLQQHLDLLRSNANLQLLLNNPGLDAKVKADLLTAVLDRTQPASLLRSFLLLLLEKERLNQFDVVCEHYEQLANEELQRVVAQVTTAAELVAEQREAVTQKIAGMTHKNVILETHVDPGILGGLVVRVNNVVLDGSLRGQLTQLRKELIGG